MLHSTARTEKRQALGFLERRVLDRVLDQAEELNISDCACILRSLTQLSASEDVFGRVLDTLYPRISYLLTTENPPYSPVSGNGQVVWIVYVLASCRQLR